METKVIDRNKIITDLLYGIHTSLKSTVPTEYTRSAPKLTGAALKLNFGILIGITGDIQGRLILAGNKDLFHSIGESMFGMPLEGEMLTSFSGELGNMIAGGLATYIGKQGVTMDITVPTIMQGDTTLSGYDKAIQLDATFDNLVVLEIHLLLN